MRVPQSWSALYVSPFGVLGTTYSSERLSSRGRFDILVFMRKICAQKFQLWFLQSWKGFFVIGSVLLVDEFIRQGYLFKMSDIIVFRPTHEKFVVVAFLLRIAGPLLARKK